MTRCATDARPPDDAGYGRALWVAFAVNLTMFAVEIVASLVAGSVSLRADALDFLGDAANYAIALAVFGRALRWRAGSALLKGAATGAFGLWVAAGAVAHAIAGTMPEPEVMGGIGLLAFTANLGVTILLYRYRRGDSQAVSVWLCTRNDALANLAVILAGVAVFLTGTGWPDIAVAAVIAGLGLNSAVRVTRQAWGEMRADQRLRDAPAE